VKTGTLDNIRPRRATRPRFGGAQALSLFFLFLLVGSRPVAAQLLGAIPALPPVVVTRTSDGLTAKIGDETLQVSVCSASVIHVVATPKPPESIHHDQAWVLDPKQSCSGAQFQFSQSDDAAVLTTATLKVELSLKRGNLKYSSISGQELLREGDAIPRTYEPVQLNGESTFHVADRFRPDATEGFYGLGQHQSGMFNYRGSTIELGQNNTDVAIPLLVSSKGYGVLWNTASFTYVDNRFPLESTFTSLAGDAVDYYMIVGPEMDQIIHEYRGLTGHAPMLPKWAYGFFQSKDRYVSQEEILGIAHRYRQEHIPLDAIVQDWFW